MLLGPAVLWILLLTVFPLVYALTTSRYGFRNGRVNREVSWGIERAFDEANWGHAFEDRIRLGTFRHHFRGCDWAMCSASFQTNTPLSHGRCTVAEFIPGVGDPAAFVIGLLALPSRSARQPAQDHRDFRGLRGFGRRWFWASFSRLLMNRELRGARPAGDPDPPLFAAPVGIGYLSRTIFYEGGGPMDRLLGVSRDRCTALVVGPRVGPRSRP